MPVVKIQRRVAAKDQKHPQKNIRRIQGLDGLRGMAALTVMFSHMSNNGLFLFPGVDFSGAGKSGVWLFFVLSAFLLLSQMLSWKKDDILNPKKWADYFIGRIFRIWPLFLIVCLTCWITTLLFGNGLPVTMMKTDFFRTISLQQGDLLLWTIPVEFKFYFVLPFIVCGIIFLLRSRFWPSFIAVCGIATAAFIIIPSVSGGIQTYRFSGIFLVGCAAAILYKKMKTYNFGINEQVLLEAGAWLMVGLFLILMPSVIGPLSGGRVEVGDIHLAQWLFSFIYGVLILCVIFGAGMLRRILESHPLVFLGQISYSLYLWHLVAVKIGIHWNKSFLAAWVIWVCAIALAWMSYRWIETPCLKYGAALRRRIKNYNVEKEGINDGKRFSSIRKA